MAKEPWGSRISTQRMRTGGLPERYQTAVWEVSSTARVIPGHLGAGPSYIRLLKENFHQRATVLARLTGWRWRIQGGVQTQSGDQGNGFTEGLAAVEQIQHGIAVVAHQHQGSVGHCTIWRAQSVSFLCWRPCCW